jgi:hypothetical protein
VSCVHWQRSEIASKQSCTSWRGGLYLGRCAAGLLPLTAPYPPLSASPSTNLFCIHFFFDLLAPLADAGLAASARLATSGSPCLPAPAITAAIASSSLYGTSGSRFFFAAAGFFAEAPAPAGGGLTTF